VTHIELENTFINVETVEPVTLETGIAIACIVAYAICTTGEVVTLVPAVIGTLVNVGTIAIGTITFVTLVTSTLVTTIRVVARGVFVACGEQ